MGLTDITILTCSACSSLILPGDRFAVAFSGVFEGVNASGEVTFRDTNPDASVHYCQDCAQQASDALLDLAEVAVESAAMLDEDADDKDEFDPMDGPFPFETDDDENLDPSTLAGTAPEFLGTCSGGGGKCCQTCDLPDRCCAGFAKGEPQEPDDDGGWGVTADEWDQMLTKASAFLGDSHLTRTACRRDGCMYENRINVLLDDTIFENHPLLSQANTDLASVVD